MSAAQAEPAQPDPKDARIAEFEVWFDKEYPNLGFVLGDSIARSIKNASRNAWNTALEGYC